jgi:hypothetical protein
MARTAEGRHIMHRVVRAGKSLEIRHPSSSAQAAWAYGKFGPHCRPLGPNGHVRVVRDPQGPYVAQFNDGNYYRTSITGKGSGEGSHIVYDPAKLPDPDFPETPSDVILAHEMNHAANNAEGGGQAALMDADPKWQTDWTNHEEKNTVAAENRYRAQRGGVRQRVNYNDLP